MSGHLHPGPHPDPDSLNAFLEGVLPEHERLQCLAHLAECSRCREVVFLAQEPRPAPAAPDSVPVWRRWFAPWPVLSGAAAAGMLVVAVSLYLLHKPPAPGRDLIARTYETQPVPAPPPPEIPDAPSLVIRESAPSAPPAATDATAQPSSAPPPPPPPVVESPRPADGLSQIAGRVTDPAGSAIAGATVALRQLAGTSSANARTDATGQFKLGGLPSGKYELQIAAPGFRQTSRQVDLQPQEVAMVASELSVGSVAETVEVTAASPAIQTAPPATTVARGNVMLMVDSAGSLFLSRNAGKSWKAVKPLWRGKVVRLVALAETNPIAAFQLTTDSGSAWLSRDGSHWFPEPPRR